MLSCKGGARTTPKKPLVLPCVLPTAPPASTPLFPSNAAAVVCRAGAMRVRNCTAATCPHFAHSPSPSAQPLHFQPKQGLENMPNLPTTVRPYPPLPSAIFHLPLLSPPAEHVCVTWSVYPRLRCRMLGLRCLPALCGTRLVSPSAAPVLFCDRIALAALAQRTGGHCAFATPPPSHTAYSAAQAGRRAGGRAQGTVASSVVLSHWRSTPWRRWHAHGRAIVALLVLTTNVSPDPMVPQNR